MSLRVRVTLILVAMVGVTVLLSWLVAAFAIIKPFAKEVTEAYLAQVVFIAEEVDRGADAIELARRFDIDVSESSDPPTPAKAHGRQGRCHPIAYRGYEVMHCGTEGAPVAVQIGGRWITVSRDIDFGAPEKKVGRFLFLLLGAVVFASIWIGSLVTRPIRTAKKAMARVAAGDLDHRLSTTGPKELAAAGAAFNAMAERIQGMLETERSLMAGISHELRTPLARLRLETELMRDRGLPEKRLSAMEADLEDMDRLIGELLEISRLSLGERKLARRQVDLAAVAVEAVERLNIETHDVTIEGAAAPVDGDHDRLVRVVSNLVQNAAKYAQAGTLIEVAIGGTSVEVRDRGPGVANVDLPRLFEPFYRAGGPTTKGLGLGLMIVHQVVTLHGGHIRATNRDGGGLSVRFELPASTLSGDVNPS